MPPMTAKVDRICPEELGDKSCTPTNQNLHLVNESKLAEPTALSVQGISTVESPPKIEGLYPPINVVQVLTAQ